MEIFLKVDQLNDEKIAYQNCLVHCPEDIPSGAQYLEINGVAYKSVGIGQVPGIILIGFAQRSKFSLAKGDNIRVKIVTNIDKKHIIKKMELKVSFNKKSLSKANNKLLAIHEEQFSNDFGKKFDDYYLSNKLVLLFNYEGINYLINVKNITTKGLLNHPGGFIDDETEFCLISDEINITFISKEILKKDFFRKDFDFTEIAIGGLNDELANIFISYVERNFKISII